MEPTPPKIFLVRHAETAWSLSGQHTGRSDVPLTERGRVQAANLRPVLENRTFAAVLSSPTSRATVTCELAGFGDVRQVDPDLHEWDYGQYNGLTRKQIYEKQDGWRLFRDGAPGGESVQAVSDRADRVAGRLRGFDADVLVFTSGHFARALAARWLNLPLAAAATFLVQPASLSVLGYEHARDQPALLRWNMSAEELE